MNLWRSTKQYLLLQDFFWQSMFYTFILYVCLRVCQCVERERERERNKESILNTSYKQTLIGCRKLISVLWIKAW